MAGQSTNTTPAEGRERFTLGLMADVTGVLDQHGYKKANGITGRTLSILLDLVETYEGAHQERPELDYRAGYLAGRADERAEFETERQRLAELIARMQTMLTELEALHAEAEVERGRVADMLTELKQHAAAEAEREQRS